MRFHPLLIFWFKVVLATVCSSLNGGANLSGTLNMAADAGWYYGVAGSPSASTTLMTLIYTHPNTDSFIFTLVDAFCPGDDYQIFITDPNGTTTQINTLSPGITTVNCTSIQYTNNPNTAYANNVYFGYRLLPIPSGFYLPYAGVWTFKIKSAKECSSGILNNIGFYARIDTGRFTKSVCAFSSSSITKTTLIPNAKQVQRITPQTAHPSNVQVRFDPVFTNNSTSLIIYN